MPQPAAATAVFAAFGLATQVVLIAFFAGLRRGRPYTRAIGAVAYALSAVGVAVGIWLLVSGASYRLYLGPLLYAAWAVFGAWADLWAGIEWRSPARWSIFGPYLLLYLAAQMFLWWPLWDGWRVGWVVFLVLFAVNTALNVSGHPWIGPKPDRRTA